MATMTRAKSVSIAASVLFNIEEDEDSIPGEASASAINKTVRTLSSPPRMTFKKPPRPGAVSNATTVQSNDDLRSSNDDDDSATFAFQRQRKRARSRKPSIYATWSFCGHALSNAVLRLITSVLTVPAIIAALVMAPRLALAFLAATLVCIGAYEFSWLAFRIHYQLLSTFNYYESKSAGGGGGGDTGSNSEENEVYPFQSFVSGNTQSTSSFSTGNFSLYAQNARESFEDPVFDVDDTHHSAAACQVGPSPLDALFFDGTPDILSSIAKSWFGGRVLIARIIFAALMTAVWSVTSHYYYDFSNFPVAAVPKTFVDFPYFFWAVNFLSSICVLCAPSVKSALSLVVQKEIFMVLMLNSMNCPLTASICEASDISRPLLQPMQTFVIGVMLLLVLRSFSATNPADLVISFMLDVLGYTYIVGAMGLLTAVVDTSDAAGTMFVRVLMVLLGVVWVAELAGYCCDAVMYHFRIHHVQLFPQRLALKFDIEAAICSIGVAVAAMLVGCELLDVPGSAGAKVFCALFAALSGRLGRLFLSLLKKAAGVRWSSRLLPGYGGLLDAVSMLLFSSLVFAQYFVYVRTLLLSAEAKSAEAGLTSVGRNVNLFAELAG